MDFSALVIRIIFLLLPGAVAASLYWKMKGRSERKDWEDFLEVIVFSLFSYGIYASFVHFINWKWNAGLQFTAFDAFFDDKVAVRWQDVFFSSFAGVGVALIASYSYQFKFINKLGKLLRATTRFGDEDVWDFVHRSPDVSGRWVVVRDHKLNLNYACWIQAFSDSGKQRELLLREVDVYDDASAQWLYSTAVLYLSRQPDELSIEILPPDDPKELTIGTAESAQQSNKEITNGKNKGE